MATVIRRDGCPDCGGILFTLLLHAGCPPGSTTADHHHVRCKRPGCRTETVVPAGHGDVGA